MTKTIPVKHFYDISAFCEETGLGRTHVYSLLQTGALTGVKVGRRTLIRHEDMEAWKASLTPYAPQSTPAQNTESRHDA